MKKIIIIIAASLLIPTLSFSQVKAKFGHIDYGTVIQLMPGIDSIQTIILEYQNELQTTGQAMASEFQKKQEEFEILKSTNPSTAVLKVRQDELQKLYQRIQEFSNSMQQDLQAKQIELLKPFQEQLLSTIKEVAKAENFTYIFDISTLVSYAQGEDITDKVKAKLNIK